MSNFWNYERWRMAYSGDGNQGTCEACHRSPLRICYECKRCWFCCRAGAARLDAEVFSHRNRHVIVGHIGKW